MTQKIKLLLFLTALALIFNATRHYSFADDDDHHKGKGWHYKIHDRDDDNDDDNGRHRRRERKRRRNKDYDGSYLKPVNNPTYEAECGECHFLYQPELLPSASWMKILDKPDDHFGEVIELDPDSKQIISTYLKANGAENSSAKRAVEIMRSLGNHVPMRITDIPYIREKHLELAPEVLKRESVGSLSNCIACHTTAKEGIYEDDHVKIP